MPPPLLPVKSQALLALGKGERFDAIFHLAAAVGVKLVVEDPVRCIETNITGTSDLLRFALTHGPDRPGAEPGPARVLIASSSEVYGKSDPDHAPIIRATARLDKQGAIRHSQ